MNAHYFDLGYTVIYKTLPHIIEFCAYPILDAEAMTYQKDASTFEPDPTRDTAEAKWFVRGYIKFDGCVNWKWNTDKSYWHTCADGEVSCMAELLKRIEETGKCIVDSYVK